MGIELSRRLRSHPSRRSVQAVVSLPSHESLSPDILELLLAEIVKESWALRALVSHPIGVNRGEALLLCTLNSAYTICILRHNLELLGETHIEASRERLSWGTIIARHAHSVTTGRSRLPSTNARSTTTSNKRTSSTEHQTFPQPTSIHWPSSPMTTPTTMDQVRQWPPLAGSLRPIRSCRWAHLISKDKEKAHRGLLRHRGSLVHEAGKAKLFQGVRIAHETSLCQAVCQPISLLFAVDGLQQPMQVVAVLCPRYKEASLGLV